MAAAHHLETRRMGGQLIFDARTHTYTVDGQVLPSVTQVLKEAGLVDYSMIPQDVLQAAARRGTAVHVACQYLDDDALDYDSLDDEIVGYIESYRKWKAATGFVVALSEQRLYHRTYRYAGTLDRTGYLPNSVMRASEISMSVPPLGDSKVLLDLKTGLILPGFAIQLAAYAAMLREPGSWRRISLKLDACGGVAVATEYPCSDYRSDFAIFQSALICVQWKRLKGVQPKNGCFTNHLEFA